MTGAGRSPSPAASASLPGNPTERPMDTIERLVASDQRHLVHPLHHPDDHKAPLVITEGRGCMLHTADGRQLIDGLAGLWNVAIGHGRGELGDAAAKQMKRLGFASAYAGGTNEPAIQLAERLVKLCYPT